MIQLSKRLRSVAELAAPCQTMADVGTDHGYIPLYLVECGKARKAIAMDINQGPLLRAQEHISQYGMEEKIETRLSDGLSALAPKEAELIVIAGMGGALMQRILSEGAHAAQAAKMLVLQPQSELQSFREFLYEYGYQILDEDMVLEDGKYYPMMAAKYIPEAREAAVFCSGPDSISERALMSKELCRKAKELDAAVYPEEKLQPEQLQRIACKYGPVLLEKRHPILKQYLAWQKQQKQQILENLRINAKQPGTNRITELEQELSDLEAALQLWNEAGTPNGVMQ